jgi:hypothetical protein
LLNQHFLTRRRGVAPQLGVVMLPTLGTLAGPMARAPRVAMVRWFDPATPASPFPAGLDGPVPGVLLHEMHHDGVRETLAFVELLQVDRCLRVDPLS